MQQEHENRPNPARLDNRINALFADFAKYTHEHSGFKEVLREMFGGHEGEELTTPESREREAEEISRKHSSTLHAIGCEIAFSKQNDSFIRSLSINVIDLDQMNRALSSVPSSWLLNETFQGSLVKMIELVSQQLIAPVNVIPKDVLNELVETEPEILKQIQGTFNYDPLDDRLFSFVHHMERLDLSQYVLKMRQTLEYKKEGILFEYLLTQQNGMMILDRLSFGPDGWHKDMTAELYSNRWQTVIDTLEHIKQNERAVDITRKFVAHIRNCIELARLDLIEEDRPGQDPQVREHYKQYPEKRRELLEILEEADKEFELACIGIDDIKDL